MSINIQKIAQRYVFSKITTFKILSAMPHSRNSIGNLSFLTVLEILNLTKTSK